MASRIAEAYVQIVPRIDGIGSSLTKGLSKEMGGVGEESAEGFASGFKKVIGPALLAASAVATAALGKFLKDSINIASNFEAEFEGVNQVFGKFASQVQKFAEEAGKSAGLGQVEALQAAKTFGLFFTGAGRSAEEAAKFSTTLVQLAGDLGSFNDVPTEEALMAIQSGLMGQAQPLRRFGVFLDDARLKQEALNMGIYNGVGPLDSQQKMLAAYNAILAQTNVQQGDFVAYADTFGNQQKILTAQMQDLSIMVGNALLPAMTTLVTFLNEKIVPSFFIAFQAIQGIFPILRESVGSLGPVFGNLAPQILQFIQAISPIGLLLKALLPVIPILIDFVTELATAFAGMLSQALELIIQSMTTLLQAVLPVVIDLFKTLMPAIQSLAPVVIKLVQAFLPLIPALLTIALAIVPLLEVLLPPLISLLGIIIPVVAKLAEVLGVVLTLAIGVLVGAFSGLVKFLPALTGAFSSVFKGIANFVIGYANIVIQSIEGMVNFVISGVNLMIEALNKLKFEVPDWVPVIGGGKFGFNLQKIAKIAIGRLPALAEGGFVNKPTTALIGEAGPEVVIPLNRFEEMMGLDGKGDGKTINYYAAPNNSLDAEQALFQAIQRSKVVTGW
jgi:hypothetical protein